MRLLKFVFVFLLSIAQLPAWSKDIVIIGGGLAGLTAAYEIQKAVDKNEIDSNTRVRLFEAKDRVGGRVMTVRLNGQPTELGGENINDGGDAVQMRRLAAELGQQIVSRQQQPTDRYFYDSKTKSRVKIDDLKTFFPKLEMQQLVDAFAKSEKNSRNISEVLDHFFKMFPAANTTEKEKRVLIRRIIEENMRSYEGGAAKDLSPRYAYSSLVDMSKIFLDRPRKPYPVDSVAGGNSELVLALAAKLKGKVQLSSPLTTVERATNGGYNLTIKGQKFYADILILALPGKPYANIKFAKDTIPAERVRQILKVGYGTHAKILIPIAGEAPKELPLTEGVSVWQRPGDRWLTAFFTGPIGVMRDQTEMRAAASLVETAFQLPAPFKNIGEIEVPNRALSDQRSAVAISWATDPYFGGSYSYFTPQLREELETTVKFQDEPVVKLFAPIDGQLFFAGEHTTVDQDIRGTMEAAVESGMRTARMVKKLL